MLLESNGHRFRQRVPTLCGILVSICLVQTEGFAQGQSPWNEVNSQTSPEKVAELAWAATLTKCAITAGTATFYMTVERTERIRDVNRDRELWEFRNCCDHAAAGSSVIRDPKA
jgi:hypothetical protein